MLPDFANQYRRMIPGRSLITVIALVAVASGGCASRTYREDQSPPIVEPRAVYQTQVTMGECVFKPRPESAAMSAIAGALLSSAVSTGVNYVGKAIEEAAKETNDRAMAVRNVEVTNETFGPCLQVARGWFFQGFTSEDARIKELVEARLSWARAALGGPINETTLNRLWEKKDVDGRAVGFRV